ncbi:DUF3089 domain-containing protein [Sphingomicrobium lutaoense]|uniref:DUF3089 domain-containing protein n=1 Tax=Sphingomicrobium lutaoense TaxID=515949 RepID=A0A839Z1T9_9SPHN|nr:DUF3089 domain-containing protein [Sphingomicrobium lutaoense]MBB3763555.1 hypothetical protein [Sphingomicrobium lutaoense]
MCARRFLIAIVLVTLLVVLAAFAIFQFGDKVIAGQSMPTVKFELPEPEAEDRYDNAEYWLARRGLPTDLTDWRPESEEEAEPLSLDPRAAVFYVHPTTYLARDRWNAPMFPAESSQRRTDLFLRTQASALSDEADIWAPRYRQAAFGAFLSREEDALRALDVAYEDVREAFRTFMAENPDRPLILAGHSQGSLHLLRLLAEERPEFGDRLVAVYLAGWPIDLEADLPATGLPLCEEGGQTGCILNWLTFGDPAKPDLVLDDWVGSMGYAEIERSRDRLACTNPANGGAEGPASPAMLVPDEKFENARLEVPPMSARCSEGLLIIEGEIPDVGPYVLPGNNYHAYDYALFWGDVRRDAISRRQAWAARS